MPTATNPPRCPHRVATTRPLYWLALALASLLGSTTATVSLHGQEVHGQEMSLLDYRFVIPAGHMQPWPDDEPDILITLPAPLPVPTTRIAAKWRTDLRPKQNVKTPSDESKQLVPALEEAESKVEVLVIPNSVPHRVPKRAATEKRAKMQAALPTSSASRDCYQAPPLSALSVNIAFPVGKLPTNAALQCAIENEPTSDARLVDAWATTEHHWSATCSRHRPLYFEEINAERYGYTVSYALQPVISAAHFFGTIPALPYKMAVDRPRDCIYTLGHYRPGSCVPRRTNHLPWQPTASVVEVGFIAGMILLIP